MDITSLKKEQWLKLIEQIPEIEKEYNAISNDLNLKEVGNVTHQIDELIQNSKTLGNRMKGFWDWCKSSKYVFIIAALMFSALIINMIIPDEWSKLIGDWIGVITAQILGMTALIKKYSSRVSNFLTKAEKIKVFTQSLADEKESELKSQLAEEENRLAKVENRLIQTKQEQVLLDQQLEEIQAGKHIEAFLHSRISDAGYKDQLGIIAMLREDFERLSRLLRQGLVISPPADASESETIALDRVIIYIDDLDRCTPKRVVEVLEAVHLLLAIDFFVVVVAVDPRWLLNSLQWHYRELFTSGSDQLQVSEEEKTAWESTPHNYMDKIFQIPFTLRPMNKKGYTDLIDGLIAIPGIDPRPNEYNDPENPLKKPGKEIGSDDTDSSGNTPPPLSTESIEKNNSDGEPENPENQNHNKAENRENIQMESLDETLPNLNPEGMTLTRIEKHLLSRLQPLLQTPRSVKRLINTYRLIRAPLQGSALTRFVNEDELSGEFVCVQILLGILIGFPNLAPDVFHNLEHQDSNDFWHFIQQLEPTLRNGSKMSNITNSKLTERETINWKKFHKAMTSLHEDVDTSFDDLQKIFEGSSELNIYRKWIPEVARYSFRAGYVFSKLNR